MPSARKGTRLFGIQINSDPRLIVGALVAIAAVLFWYNSSGDDSGQASSPSVGTLPGAAGPAPASPRPAAVVQRRNASLTSDRTTLRLRAVDATRGDVDPTLRLDLLNRLASIQQAAAGRSLFELATTPPAAVVSAPKIVGPTIQVKNPVLPGQLGPGSTALPITVNIPFKYYGYVKPTSPVPANKGLFLDGENILVASEGELVRQRYLVVELTPNSARLEDTQLKQGQTLPVMPVAAQ
jgi:hypothetical protein